MNTKPVRSSYVSGVRVTFLGKASSRSAQNDARGSSSLVVPPGSESGKQVLFVFHNILAGIHSLSTGKSTFALVGDAHFDIVGKSSQPFKYLAIPRDLAVAAQIPLPALRKDSWNVLVCYSMARRLRSRARYWSRGITLHMLSVKVMALRFKGIVRR